MKAPDHANAAMEQNPDAEGALYRDVIVVGASAGGVEALERLVAGLPRELPASIFVVLHLLPSGASLLDSILSRAGPLAATAAVDGERFERGHIYVAPPDHHLLLQAGTIELSPGPRENGHRPAIDPLFRSAARSFGARVISVVLSGALDDGAAGARFVKERGGVALVQDPEDALYPAMPRNPLAATDIDHVVPVDRIPAVLSGLLEEPLDRALEEEAESLWRAEDLEERGDGEPSGLTCPECGGSLSQRDEGKLIRFACRTGHAYSPQSLMQEQSTSLEQALWSALRGLEERADLIRRMARRTRPDSAAARRLESRAVAVERHAGVIRDAMAKLEPALFPDTNGEPAA